MGSWIYPETQRTSVGLSRGSGTRSVMVHLMAVLCHQERVQGMKGQESIIVLKGARCAEIGLIKHFKHDPPGRFRVWGTPGNTVTNYFKYIAKS